MKYSEKDKKMQIPQEINYQSQIEQATKKAKCKKVLYLYDEYGKKQLLGVFSEKKAAEVRESLRVKKLIDRLSEFQVRTTEPDSEFSF